MGNTDYLIEVKNVSKKIKGRQILDNISFKIAPGRIMGFIGPNGAGKTTMLKMLTGLMFPTSGEIKICGHDIQQDYEQAAFNLGTIIENPEFYNYMSGFNNLQVFADMSRQSISKNEIIQSLASTGLKGAEQQKVKGYSLGMRQRLGVANATIHQPKVLILDEPMNGLDPEGMKDFRNLMKNFVRNGNSIIISSHLLAELQEIVNDIFIVNRGRQIYAGTMTDFLGKSNNIVHVEVGGDILVAEKILQQKGYQVTNQLNSLEIAINQNDHDPRAEIAKLLLENNIPLIGLKLTHYSLEDSFLNSINSDNQKKG
ncbi:ABC transporter ATP-binding protein [Snodgrassella gandavensis]|uniref:ABC transporter ATP-binding protein n=1 Tax=Snodgrassella gandavensis TaxID=2946698 RepID=UPI001EF6C131|nr:ABC transporter ATP-binding protein [Snodgrassella gandavensis]